MTGTAGLGDAIGNPRGACYGSRFIKRIVGPQFQGGPDLSERKAPVKIPTSQRFIGIQRGPWQAARTLAIACAILGALAAALPAQSKTRLNRIVEKLEKGEPAYRED